MKNKRIKERTVIPNKESPSSITVGASPPEMWRSFGHAGRPVRVYAANYNDPLLPYYHVSINIPSRHILYYHSP